MAKKSKRPPARKQQARRPAPHQRPGYPLPGLAGSTAPARGELDDAIDTSADQTDYAATALPYAESDGPMPLPPPEPAAAPAAAAAPTAGSERRRVGRIDPAAAAQERTGPRARGGTGRLPSLAAMFEPLPPEDAAIPFDRVPYVPGDLRRVLIIAGLMVVLIVVANFAINAIVK